MLRYRPAGKATQVGLSSSADDTDIVVGCGESYPFIPRDIWLVPASHFTDVGPRTVAVSNFPADAQTTDGYSFIKEYF